jgi:hypothetical protein
MTCHRFDGHSQPQFITIHQRILSFSDDVACHFARAHANELVTDNAVLRGRAQLQ